MRVREIVAVSCGAVVVGLVQSVFVTFLPMPWFAFQPVLLIIVAFTLRGVPQRALLFALVSGFIIDAFTPGVGGAAALRFFFVALPLTALASSVLTNRSMYAALALDILAHAMDWVLHFIFVFATRFIGTHAAASLPLLSVAAASVGWDALLIIGIYIARSVFGQRFVFTASRSRRYG